jgi:long-chain acyl-CoA synthetase
LTGSAHDGALVAGMLDRLAAAAPHSVAVIDAHDNSYTFAELAAAASEIRSKLTPGGRVAVRIGNDVSSVMAVHAAWSAGCSVVAVGVLTPEREAIRRISVTGAAVLLEPDHDGGLAVAAGPTGHPHAPAPADEALVMFTSGTTGVPKGASITFRALQASVTGIGSTSGIADTGRLPASRDPVLVMVPMAHMGGMLGLVAAWWLGKPLLIVQKFTAETTLQLAARHRLGVLRLTPAMVYELTHYPGDARFPGVHSATVGTAALPEKTRMAFESRYGIPILRNYGSTEFAGAIAFERADDVADGRRPPGTVGRLAPGVEVVILDPLGEQVAAGQVGEITVSASRSAMSGYLGEDGRPDAMAGWFRTGDLGSLDADGFLTVIGRVKDMIVCGGFNVYPAQVEAALNALDEVADSAVAGIEDERLGEIPVAAVVAAGAGGFDQQATRTALRAELAPYEIPRAFIEVAAIPRLDTGKVDRAGVAALFTSGATSSGVSA